MKLNRHHWQSVAAVALVAAPAPVLAQQAGLQITVVRADGGAPVSSAQVTIENPDIGLSRVLTTDDNGQVRVDGLTTGGRYRIAVTAGSDYEAQATDGVVLRTDFVRGITLAVGGSGSKDLVVTGRRTVTGINTVNAEISASLPAETLRALPIEAVTW